MPVYKRNGHWHFTKTINGVRHRCALPTARTKGQAEEAERQKLKEIHEGTFGKAKGSGVFIDFAEQVYLLWSKENKRSPNDQYHIETFKAFFKRKTFAEITPILIEKFKSERRRTPVREGSRAGPPRSTANSNACQRSSRWRCASLTASCARIPAARWRSSRKRTSAAATSRPMKRSGCSRPAPAGGHN